MEKDNDEYNNDDILDIFMQLSDLYINMMADLEGQLEEVGGVLNEFSPTEGIISVKVDPEHEEVIAEYVKGLINQYNTKRAELLKSDPFIGIKALLLGEEE